MAVVSLFTGLGSLFGRWVIWFYYVYLFIYLFFTSANFLLRHVRVFLNKYVRGFGEFVFFLGVFFQVRVRLVFASWVWLGCLDFCYLNGDGLRIEFLTINVCFYLNVLCCVVFFFICKSIRWNLYVLYLRMNNVDILNFYNAFVIKNQVYFLIDQNYYLF